jgi:phage FluMu protein Com
VRAYAKLRGTCPNCRKTFDLEHRNEEPDQIVKLNRGDCAILPNPAGWYMPPHRVGEGWNPCYSTYRLIQAGR